MTTRILSTLLLASAAFAALWQPSPASAQSDPGQPPTNPALIGSPWAEIHRGSPKQASSPLPGPERRLQVQVRNFINDTGKAIGTSPIHVLSEKKYDDPDARTIWGATLTDLYKYQIDGPTFRFVDRVNLNTLSFFVTWNLFGLDGNRIIVPDPNGAQTADFIGTPCFGREAALLEFGDGDTPNSPIRCVKKFEFADPAIQNACGWPAGQLRYGTAAVINGVLYNGDIVAMLIRQVDGQEQSWAAIVDNDLDEIRACEFVDDTAPSNQIPVERIDFNTSLFYVATEDKIVAMEYKHFGGRLSREGAFDVDFRDRTGTTPTLVGFGDAADKFIVAIDAKCAVSNVFTGEIECSDDTRPSRLVAFRRDRGYDDPDVFTLDLPDYVETVENSPAVSGYDLITASYSGYRPDGVQDGVPNFAKGVVKASWKPGREAWEIDWTKPDLQVSGIFTIAEGSNIAYGPGTEEATGDAYLYGFRFRDDARGDGGDVLVEERLGSAFESSPGAQDQIYDAGNNTILNDDRSVVLATGNTLVRVRQR